VNVSTQTQHVVESIEGYAVRSRQRGVEPGQDTQEKLLANGRIANWSQELRPAKGQAFLRHHQIEAHPQAQNESVHSW